MIKAVIVDDETKAVSGLKSLIRKYCNGITVVGEANSVEEAKQVIIETVPDVVFLDIEMPDSGGFALLDEMKQVSFEVIFTTAYNQHAIKAIKYAALDYLLKPIDLKELKEAVNKLKQKQTVKLDKQRIELLIHNLSNHNGVFARIAVPSQNGISFFNTNEIILLEADGSYTNIYTLYNEQVTISSKNLKYFEGLLPKKHFIKTHRKFLVNKHLIKEYRKGDSDKLVLINGFEVDISFRKKDAVLRSLLPK